VIPTDLFLCKIDSLKIGLAEIRKKINLFIELSTKVVYDISFNDDKTILNDLIEEIGSLIRKMAEEVRQIVNLPENSGTEYAKNSYKNIYSVFVSEFLKVMHSWKEAQTNYQEKITEKLRRQIKIVSPSATDQQITALIEAGYESINIFTNSLFEKLK